MLDSKIDTRTQSLESGFGVLDSKIDTRTQSLESAFGVLDSKIDTRTQSLESAIGLLDSKMNLLGLFVAIVGLAIAVVTVTSGGAGGVAITIDLGEAIAELLPRS